LMSIQPWKWVISTLTPIRRCRSCRFSRNSARRSRQRWKTTRMTWLRRSLPTSGCTLWTFCAGLKRSTKNWIAIKNRGLSWSTR
jgi:hypothetical protein